MKQMNSNQTHQSLKRGLHIIEAISAIGSSATLAEVARKTALPRSTAYHLLRALVEFGYLVQEGDARTYTLAPKLFHLTGSTWTREQLAEIAMPFLDELSRRTGEGTSLAVLRDGVVTVIAKREPEGPVRVFQEVGATRPIYCTAVGKALAAWLPEQELIGIISRTVFKRKTAKTITSPTAFRRELARIRAIGSAFDNEEHMEGIRCIATPVRDYSGDVRASLCVVGPKSRLPQRRLSEIRQALAAVSVDLSARLGHGSTGETDDRSRGKGLSNRQRYNLAVRPRKERRATTKIGTEILLTRDCDPEGERPRCEQKRSKKGGFL